MEYDRYRSFDLYYAIFAYLFSDAGPNPWSCYGLYLIKRKTSICYKGGGLLYELQDTNTGNVPSAVLGLTVFYKDYIAYIAYNED